MKNNPFLKSIALLAATLFLAGFTATATAGPGPTMMFHAVKSEKEAAKLKIGTQIAVACGNCGGITVMTVDADRSYLRGFTCPTCKKTFSVIMPGGGGRGTLGSFAYSDDAGHTATLTAHN
jgi:hypothetical protein